MREATNRRPPATKRASEIDMAVAHRLRLARWAAGLSQQQAAEACGVTFQQIQKYESGQNRISIGRLVRLAAAFNHPPEWFLQPAGRMAEVGEAVKSQAVSARALRLAQALLRLQARMGPRVFTALLGLVVALEATADAPAEADHADA